MSSAVERLTRHYQNPFAQAIEKANAGTPIAGITSNTVPWELLRAAGYFPLMLNPARGPAPLADRFMEGGVFAARIRGIFNGLASGAWPFLRMVVIPRTSEQEHKLFLYLREMVRQGFSATVPDLYLYNLLHAHSTEAEQYGLKRTRELSEYVGTDDLACAVEESNHARRAVRNLLAFRETPEPRLSGTEALAVTGAMYFIDRTEYAMLADEAAVEISSRASIRGPRILIKGSPLHHSGLHRAIEAYGAVVIGEDDWWGSRVSTTEISTQGDVVRAIFETYYRGVPSPRASSNAWFLDASAKAEGVVFYLPPEDDVLGWDYPRLRQILDERGTPNLLVREDASEEPSPECNRQIEDFVRRLRT